MKKLFVFSFRCRDTKSHAPYGVASNPQETEYGKDMNMFPFQYRIQALHKCILILYTNAKSVFHQIKGMMIVVSTISSVSCVPASGWDVKRMNDKTKAKDLKNLLTVNIQS